ncbi:MAG: hypothetical protein O3A63_19380 [Proteobacteria bacterium]|nr:hypothetical protein [Pseudomonadota bacterium]
MPDNHSTTAIVEYQIRAENNSMQEWLDVWSDRAEDARVGEPQTAAYAAAINLEAPDNVLVFERYQQGDQSLKLHVDRDAHSHLTRTMGDRNMTRRRVMSSLFNDVDSFGWWGRPQTMDANASGHILILLGMRFATPAMRDDFLGLSAQHAVWCWENEPETTLYSGGLARADADRELDLKQGDLVFVMGATSMEAVIKHRDEPQHLALGEEMTARGITPELTFQRSYESTGRGFMWR